MLAVRSDRRRRGIGRVPPVYVNTWAFHVSRLSKDIRKVDNV